MISVVLPTYNERDNLQELFERLADVLANHGQEYEIIVVDDSSPDGTAESAESIGSSLGLPVRVFVRQSDPDLSRSVVRGIQEARGEVVVVMDADLQHPPERIPELVSMISTGTPVVVATRYSHGGKVQNWPLFRRLVSYGAMTLAKALVPPTRGISDPISGFFAIRRASLDYDELSPNGYKILVELLANIQPETVPEVGFVFVSRERGETSLDLEQYYRFLLHTVLTGFRYRLNRLL